jgi:hypothetical protein
MFGWIRKAFYEIVRWFRPNGNGQQSSAQVPRPPEPPPPQPPPPPEPYPEPKAKWVKPKGTEKLTHHTRAHTPPRDPSKPKRKRPEVRPDTSPEKWGQYYFRDAILDQLDRYFIYLKRMKYHDRDAYELHRRLGIHIMPQSAVQAFDDWRDEGSMDDLDTWFIEHRPGFGAVSYGLDYASVDEEHTTVVDASPEQMKEIGGWRNLRKDPLIAKHRTATVSRGESIKLKSGETVQTSIIWIPKFLYFTKYKKPPAEVQKVSDGDVYQLTVYWDRTDHHSKGFDKRHKGGIPQDYAVCVDKSGKVRILRMLIHEKVNIRTRHGIDRGKMFSIPNTHWGIPTDYLNWAVGRKESPENYLRRCFIEAALMYETASLGSMIRIEATKGGLTAAFAVEIKRTAYFFKDRDVGNVTATGRKKPIFHIVRPHMRHTKHGDKPVKMQFRGDKEFEWAGYQIKITVPGIDHFHLPEFNVGSVSLAAHEVKKGMVNMAELGDRLKEGMQKWKPNGTSQ